MSKRIDYAPGNYLSFCMDCDAKFMGHLLAVRCEQCAASVDGAADRFPAKDKRK